MASLKVLGQLNPAATTLSTLYIAAASPPTQASVDCLTVCNRGATAATFRLSIQVAGAADDYKQYIYWDLPVPANNTYVANINLRVGPGDVVKCYASNTNLCFTLSGVEI